jgi:hypothetical protein
LTIFRDLLASGIRFLAHDVRNRAERRSPYDLVVSRQRGDIKSTTYFLHIARTPPLNCDFYITRLYHSRGRRYLDVVILSLAAWRALNGEVPTVSLETAANFMPKPVQIVFREQHWIIVPYDLWKQRVKQRQQTED